MAVIDVIRVQGGSFIGDNTQQFIDVIPSENFMSADYGNRYRIEKNDNLRVLSCWACLPYCYCTANEPLAIFIRGKETPDVGSQEFFIDELGSTGYIFQPTENVEVEIDEYIPFVPTSPNGNEWGFWTEVHGRVSQFNAPDALNGQELPVWAYLKILHNLPLGNVIVGP